MTIYIVTDLGYGDAGKGTTVDFLARQGKSLVVRHNGGPQAGHNVVTLDGRHHEFAQFGAGTFAGADTYLSRFMCINPLDMRMEWKHLYDVGERDVWLRTHVDEEARIITPWHVALNRQRERSRGDDRHGSCGRGVGELMAQDIDAPAFTLRVKDVRRYGLKAKLNILRDYLREQAFLINADVDIVFQGNQLINDIADEYYRWFNHLHIVDSQWLDKQSKNYDHLIFEGAQGVLLDEWYGFHPYTTWSTTTYDNALQVLFEAGYEGSVTRLGVTRAYMTRHGAGPFVTEDEDVHFVEPHNTHSLWQGRFRQGHLDILALKYAVDACGGIDGLVVTHLDRANSWKVATSYNIDYHFDAVAIDARRGDHDLERRERLTNLLFKASPTYISLDGVSTEGLLAMLEHIAPIHITSHGPTHADKQWARKDALV